MPTLSARRARRRVLIDSVTVHAPGTTSNLGPGFDCLGVALSGQGDRVTARRTAAEGVAVVGSPIRAFRRSLRATPRLSPRRRSCGGAAAPAEWTSPSRRGCLSPEGWAAARPRRWAARSRQTRCSASACPTKRFSTRPSRPSRPCRPAGTPTTWPRRSSAARSWSWPWTPLRLTRLEVHPSIRLALVTPRYSVETSQARRVLPDSVRRSMPSDRRPGSVACCSASSAATRAWCGSVLRTQSPSRRARRCTRASRRRGGRVLPLEPSASSSAARDPRSWHWLQRGSSPPWGRLCAAPTEARHRSHGAPGPGRSAGCSPGPVTCGRGGSSASHHSPRLSPFRPFPPTLRDRDASGACRLRGRGLSLARRGPCVLGQHEAEGAPLAELGLDPHLTAVALDDQPADVEARGPSPDRQMLLGPHALELAEEPVDLVLGDSRGRGR